MLLLQLDFPGIRVSSISIEGPGGQDSISTFWERSMVDLGRGMDFSPRGSVLARFTHLQHQEYSYVFLIGSGMLFQHLVAAYRKLPLKAAEQCRCVASGGAHCRELWDFAPRLQVPKMADARQKLLLFFDRPTEPIFMEKGDDKTRFNLPENYYPEEYKDLVNTPSTPLAQASQVAFLNVIPDIPEQFSTPFITAKAKSQKIPGDIFLKSGEELPTPYSAVQRELSGVSSLTFETNLKPIIDVGEITLPDISLPMELPKEEQFSFFIPNHREMAGRLIDIFMSMPTVDDLTSIFAYCQPRINPYMFNYCVSVAILHRPDTKGMDIPTFAETFPDKFVDRKSLRRAREYCAIAPDGATLPLIKIQLPVNPDVPEQRLAYFREDVGLNSHHWHWHLIYPTDATNSVIVSKDRRGELFYYMHHQVMARYNTERMCNGLERTEPYYDFRHPIADGYFPLLDSANASRAWAPRFDHISIRDVYRSSNNIKATISEMETWRSRLLEAVESQSILQLDGSQLQLDEETGIDILGNLVEATLISHNPVHYGDYHNKGHMLIAYVHDPDGRHAQQNSVMGDSATAMRDPVFYRWHACIDNIFMTYKDKLTPYGPDKLVFPEISVSSINIESNVAEENVISTLWERSTMNLINGLDFAPRRNVYAQFTHLQHEEFEYVIELSNTSGESQVGTVRIFMAPIVDQAGNPLTFEEQRKLMIEMDKFSQTLCPGKNTVRRSSLDSSVTIPFERIFRKRNAKGPGTEITFCDCGWPQHMLVPRGNTEGFPVVVFVMITDWKEDKVERDLTGADNDNASYCGLRDQKYPDRRAMGFPFDRRLAPGINWLRDFLQPNMAFRNCIIKFTDRTRDRDEENDKPREEKREDDHKCDCAPGQCSRTRDQCDRTRGQCSRTRGQCGRTQDQSDRTQGQCDRSRGQCGRNQDQSDHTQGQCDRSRGQCGRNQDQSDHTQGQCDRSRGQCGRNQDQSDHTQGQCDRSRGQCGRNQDQSDHTQGQCDRSRGHCGPHREDHSRDGPFHHGHHHHHHHRHHHN